MGVFYGYYGMAGMIGIIAIIIIVAWICRCNRRRQPILISSRHIQYPAAQAGVAPNAQYPPNIQYPPNQHPPNRYPPNQYPPNQFPGGVYPASPTPVYPHWGPAPLPHTTTTAPPMPGGNQPGGYPDQPPPYDAFGPAKGQQTH